MDVLEVLLALPFHEYIPFENMHYIYVYIYIWSCKRARMEEEEEEIHYVHTASKGL